MLTVAPSRSSFLAPMKIYLTLMYNSLEHRKILKNKNVHCLCDANYLKMLHIGQSIHLALMKTATADEDHVT